MTAATEIELTLSRAQTYDWETDEETAVWQVTSEYLPRPCQDEDPAEALRLLAECLDIEGRVTIEELAGQEGEEDAPQQQRTDSEDRTCDLEGCSEPTSVRARTGRYCDSDHSIADSNDWPIEDLEAFDVEYDGEIDTWRAPSKEDAESQWKAAVRASRK